MSRSFRISNGRLVAGLLFLLTLCLVLPVPAQAQGQGNAALVSAIQTGLNQLGFEAGPADGVPGARTRDAITAFQNDNDLPATGRPTPDVLAAIERRLAGAPAVEERLASGQAASEQAATDGLAVIAPALAPELPAEGGRTSSSLQGQIANARWLFDDGNDVRVPLYLRGNGTVAGPNYARSFRWRIDGDTFVLTFENAIGATTRREGSLVDDDRMQGVGTSSRGTEWRWTATRLP